MTVDHIYVCSQTYENDNIPVNQSFNHSVIQPFQSRVCH